MAGLCEIRTNPMGFPTVFSSFLGFPSNFSMVYWDPKVFEVYFSSMSLL